MLDYIFKNYERLSRWPLVSRLTAKKFTGNGPKVLIIAEPNRISYDQVYPFLFYRGQLHDRFKAEIRLVTHPQFASPSYSKAHQADIVLLQTWFNIQEDALRALLDKIHKLNPEAKIHFLDSFAPTDLRLAKTLNPYVTSYIKKSLLKDRNKYLQPQVGDTNLVGFYSGLFGLEAQKIDWNVPQAFLEKLVLGPTFFTGPDMLHCFLENVHPPKADKTIDVHARVAAKGSSWYGQMRQLSVEKLAEIEGLTTATGTGIPRDKFMQELESAKTCFSPFGYGEICWRDVESILAGAVLIKPSMEHLDMAPNIHVAEETYLPVKWDYSDLEEKLNQALQDQDLRSRLTENAYRTIREYLIKEKFVDQFAYLFEH